MKKRTGKEWILARQEKLIARCKKCRYEEESDYCEYCKYFVELHAIDRMLQYYYEILNIENQYKYEL